MNRLVHAELLKIRTTRTTVVLVLAGLALAAFLGVTTAAFAGIDGAAPLGSAPMIDNVVGVSAVPAALALLLGVMLAAGEHQHGTVTTTFLITPRRHLVIAAKVVAAAFSGALVTAGMVVAAIAGAAPRTLAEGADLELAWSTGATIAGLLLASALLAGIGVLLGHLLRSQVAAVVAVLLWFVLLEAIADTMTGGGLHRWLPGGAATALAGAGTAWEPVLVLTAWAVGLAALTVPAVLHRDVT